MPKGDANNLRADLADGFARIANLLTEALCCAPLSGAEFRVLMFVIRRTYGWARENRAKAKMDCITSEEIAKGTGLPRGTVGNSLSALCRANVLTTELAANDNRRRYGVNPSVDDWGEPKTDWSMFRVTLKDARDTSSYNPIDLSPATGRPVPDNRKRSYRKQEEVFPDLGGLDAETPRGARAEGAATEEGTENDSLHPSDVSETGLFGPGEVPSEPAPEPPSTAAANACLAVWGLAHTDLPTEVPKGSRAQKPPKTAYYSAMGSIIGKLSGGAEELAAWAEAEGPGTRKLGTDAKPWIAIPEVVRAEVTAGTWQAIWQKVREAGGGNNGQACLLFSDGTKTWERDWAKEPWEGDSYEFRTIVARETAADNWVRAKGVTKRPVVGLCCADGYFYRGTAAEPTRAEKVF